ncbi:BtpA/SgcQ family protein [Leifsonia sp. NPDC056665]|uniref:BtpA/SgcQ family protein n=1 Tax=Leifsonia sp. NPDC056665 TaxID=3345901 RepID=UPI0036D0FAE3
MIAPRLVGMIHLPALPGSPAWGGEPLSQLSDEASADAAILQEAGFDAVLVQNSLDRPTRERVDGLVIAQMTAITTRLRSESELAIGVNIVKNDGPAAVAIAAASGADFVRVKLLTGTTWSAEGVLHGCAHETLSTRRASGATPAIWADVREPTSRAEPGLGLSAAIVDALDFGSADGVIVTGRDTDETLALAEEARRSHPKAHLVIGGRVDASSVFDALRVADTVIIGSALKATPGIRGRVDFDAARAIADAAADGVRVSGGAFYS